MVTTSRPDPDFHALGDLLTEAGLPAGSDPSTRATAFSTEATAAGGRQSRVSGLARRLAMVWAEAVGPEIADNARPRQLRNGRLVVSTSSSAWAQSLQFMAEDIRGRLNEMLGEEAVRTMFFRHAGWEASLSSSEPAAQASAAASALSSAPALGGAGVAPDPGARAGGEVPRTLDADQRAALRAVRESGLAADLTATIERAMMAAFSRPPVREEK